MFFCIWYFVLCCAITGLPSGRPLRELSEAGGPADAHCTLSQDMAKFQDLIRGRLSSRRTTMKILQPCYIDSLPAELLERLFRMLPPRELKVVVLVCRRWREVGEAPMLWASWVWPFLTETNLRPLVAMMAAGRRLAAVQHINVLLNTLPKDLLHLLQQLPTLQTVDFSFSNLSKLDPRLLASFVTKLRSVSFRGAQLKPSQINLLLAELLEKPNKIEELNLCENNLSTVDSNLLAKISTKVKYLKLEKTYLTTKQINEMLPYVSNGSCLKGLNLSDVDLTDVNPSELARAASNLEELYLCGTGLSSEVLSYIVCQNHQKLNFLQIDKAHVNVNHILLGTACRRYTIEELSEKQRRKQMMDHARLNRVSFK